MNGRKGLVAAGVIGAMAVAAVVAWMAATWQRGPSEHRVVLEIEGVTVDGWDAWVVGRSVGLPDGALVRAKVSAEECRVNMNECMAEGWGPVVDGRWSVRVNRRVWADDDGTPFVIAQFLPYTGDASVAQPPEVLATFGRTGEHISSDSVSVGGVGGARYVWAGRSL